LLLETVEGMANILAFMFSWESVIQVRSLVVVPMAGLGIFLQLMVIAPNRRKGLMLWVAGAVLAVVVAWVGTNWLKNKRVSNQLYLSALFPPSWRMATAVPVEQLITEAQSLQSQLDARLKEQDDGPEDAEDGKGEEE
jgi:Ni/Fe-hydrogenase subunit HybB-like protein